MIDNLTNDITRLCGEIAALRDSRAVLRNNLAQGREDREDTVSQMLADFRNSRMDVADRTRTELRNFVGTVKGAVTELKQGVAAFQEEFLGDLTGARRAWCGHNSMHSPSRMAAKEQPEEFAPKGKKKKH
jgi:hypothetical protein